MNMAIRFRVEHVNHYRYGHRVGLNYGEARLLPRGAAGQRVVERDLVLAPPVDDRRERDDVYGNRVVWFTLRHPHQDLMVTATSLIERTAAPRPEESPPWEAVAEQLGMAIRGAEERMPDCITAREFRLASPHVPAEEAVVEYARASFPPGRPLLDAVADLAARIQADFDYRPNATRIDTPVSEVLAGRHGVCQDFAHLALAGLRGLGLAARYVSGYLETTPPAGAGRQVGADASHAWIGVYLPQVGWFDFDPTNGVATGEGHLTLAWGRDYGDVAPLKGVIYGGGTHSLHVAVTVSRVGEGDDAHP
jgi:transglutaminase-like putative cysteine protease